MRKGGVLGATKASGDDNENDSVIFLFVMAYFSLCGQALSVSSLSSPFLSSTIPFNLFVFFF